jgi:hypothetical protein
MSSFEASAPPGALETFSTPAMLALVMHMPMFKGECWCASVALVMPRHNMLSHLGACPAQAEMLVLCQHKMLR